jgi:hypothetical protein
MNHLVRSDRKDWSHKEPVPEVMWLKAAEGCYTFTKDRSQAMRMDEERAKRIADGYNSRILKTDFGSGRLSVEPDSIME